jgi:hypothetical protein
MAMMLHPEAQRRAHAEIDGALAENVFPDLSHRKSLPYVEAILRETMRWHSVAPLGSSLITGDFGSADIVCNPALPHMTSCDDIFEGYFIPKGALFELKEMMSS